MSDKSTLVLFTLLSAGWRSGLVHLYSPLPPLPVTAQRLIWGSYLSWSNVRSGLEDKQERITEVCQHCSSYDTSAHHQDTQQSCEVARGHHRLLVCPPFLSISPPCTNLMYCRRTQKTLKHSNVLITRWTSNMMSTVSLGVTFYSSVSFSENKSQFGNSHHRETSKKLNLISDGIIVSNKKKKTNENWSFGIFSAKGHIYKYLSY